MEVVPASQSDISRIIEIQFSAFEGDPYQEALFPGPYYAESTRQGAVDRTVKYWDTDPSARWLVCKDNDSGTTLGFALYNIYDQERPEAEWKKEPEVFWCEGRQQEVAMNFLMMNARLRWRVWEGSPYILLNLLCIHKDDQRKGAGTKMVQWGMQLADEKGLPLYLEASPAGFHLYKKLGFQQVDVEYVRAGEWDGDYDREYIAMIRHASKDSGSSKS